MIRAPSGTTARDRKRERRWSEVPLPERWLRGATVVRREIHNPDIENAAVVLADNGGPCVLVIFEDCNGLGMPVYRDEWKLDDVP